MQVTCTRIDSANATIQAILPYDALVKTVDKLAEKASKSVKIDGFRKGKVPLAIVKSRMSDQLQHDAKNEMVRQAFERGLKELAVAADKILIEPSIRRFEEIAEGIAVEMALSLRPEISIEGYEALIPVVNVETPSDEEIEARIKEIGASMAPFETLDTKRGLVEGDIALIDFEGFLDGVAFDGGKAEGYALEIGSNRFVPGFEEQLIGMEKDEEREITVTFPTEYDNKALAGKEATFKVKLNEIQKRADVVMDDELAKKILPNDEEATLEKLKDIVKEAMFEEAKRKKYADEFKPALLDALLEKFIFDIPSDIVEREIDLAVRGKINQMTEEEIEGLREDAEKVKTLRESVRDEAAKSVRATFLIDELARIEAVSVSDRELIQSIYYEAISMGHDPKQMLEYYRANNLLSAMKMAMIEDRLLGKLLDKKLA